MSDYEIYYDSPFEDEELNTPHVPLDWSEELNLEEYLERVKKNSNKIINS